MGRAAGALRALLAKNWTLKARHPVATWSELANPLLCILLFALLKSLDTDLMIPAGWATASANASSPVLGSRWSLFAQTDLMTELNSSLASAGVSSDALFGGTDTSSSSSSASLSSTALLLQLASALQTPRFYFTETTMAGLLVGLALQGFMEGDRLSELNSDDMLGCALKFVLLGYTGRVGSSPYAVPVECRGRVVPFRIAITPDTAFTRAYFAAVMEKWHPRLPLAPSVYGISMLTAPAFRDSSVFFDNETALEAYMGSEDYGTSSKRPKIYAAIAFEQFPNGDDIGDVRGYPIAYSLRFNATTASSGFPSSVPHTRSMSRFASSTSRLVNPAATLSYATRGFMTLQTAVARFLNCLPDWDAASQSTTGECQVPQAVSNASNEDEDANLMQQVENDMIISSAFNVIASMKDLLPDSLGLGGSGSDAGLNVSAATIPDSSKQQLLQSLRVAPQAHMGAGVFVSPKPAFRYAPFYDKVSVVFPVGFVLSYLYTVSRMVVAFLTEKETRSRELMRIFGVSDALLFASWLVTYTVLLALATALQTVFARALLFPNSSASLLFAFFFSFALSSFAFAFLVSAFFSRARSGSFVAMGLFFMIFFVSYSFGDETGEAQRTWASLLSPVALAQGISILAKVEAVSVGISSANASELFNGFRFETAIYMQLVDFALYVAVAAYAQIVVPQEFGVPEKWYFPVTPAYWRRLLGRPLPSHSSRSKVANDIDMAPTSACSQSEPVGEDLRLQEREARAVIIAGLCKEYKARGGGVKIAVNNLRLTLYEGQVTCLLGHNGAGKSTLMSMLTGMTAPSSGEAVVRGHPISTSMSRVRESLGYCPQASVLYPELTVEEHLRLYGRIKGIASSLELDKEIHAKMSEVGLEAKRRTKAHALSGGMQRRLSLAIAFLGESKVVFLDEPTSGMDPYSRRSTWELIRSSRHGRVVVLTTHFMDEADVLGDRIAILADGALQCVGSSLFLKNHFGVGYRLSITLQTSEVGDRGGQSSMDQSAAVSSLVSLARSHVPLAIVATSIGTELTLQLPFESAPAFPTLFRELDRSCTELGVLSYAISVTTLEEVFLKVLEGGQQQYLSGWEDKDREIRIDRATVNATAAQGEVAVAVPEPQTLAKRGQVGTPLKSIASSGRDNSQLGLRQLQHGRRFMMGQFVALVRKRVLYGKRDRNMLVFRTVLPIVVIFTGLAALRQSIFLKNDPKKLLTSEDEYSLGNRSPIPVSFPGEALSSSAFADVLTETFTGGEVFEVVIPQQVYDGSTTPTVFGVTYSPPELEPSDTSGYCLRFSELAFESGFGVEAPETTKVSDDTPIQVVSDQQGGYVVYGSTEDHVLAYNLLVNTSATHAAPIFKAMMDEAVHKHLLMRHATSLGRPMTQEEVDRVAIRVSSHPLPLSFKTRTLFSSFLSLPAVIFVVIAFTFIPASVMPFLVREKQDGQNAKYQQLLSGVSLPAYWLANFAFDFALYVVPMVGALLLLRGFGVSSSLSSNSAACSTCTQDVPSALVALFVLFGTAVAPWTYLLSHLMHDPRSCLLYTIMLNFLLGIVLILISYTMGTLASTKPANDALVYLWRFSPLFSLGNGLLSVIVADIKALYGLSGHVVSAFDEEIAGTDIAYLAVQGPAYFLLTIFVDEYRNRTARHDARSITGGNIHSFWSRILVLARLVARTRTGTDDQQRPESTINDTSDVGDEKEDEDIAAETRRLRNGPTKTDDGDPLLSLPVKVVGLRKRYPNGKLAVQNLTIGLGTGECFGFLGINGAGKTTTMRILTGDLAPTAGSASLNGFDILTQRRDARRSIGYCPQFDALLDLLTVREHLELYAQLKGLTPVMNDGIVRLLRKLHLEQFEHKLAGTLSGGNKRKLSVAIALLGDPKVVFLDEPSTGMDPASRRLMWDVILDVSVRSKQSTVVLTTHSMDECEALCSKAGIMVDGRLQCLGSISHLKARFGDGFLLDCKLRSASAEEVKQLQVDRLSAFDHEIDSTRIADVCVALGNAERAAAFAASIVSSTTADRGTARSVSVSHLCAWWIMEERMEALAAFLHQHFSGSTSLDDHSLDHRRGEVVQLERQGDYCRYRLAAASSEAETSLADMFELIEGEKTALAIQEYSVSHTSLEQIFNNFARQQQSSSPPP
jgi:ATP-binding cassette subfamily A (ABC1) protein 3